MKRSLLVIVFICAVIGFSPAIAQNFGDTPPPGANNVVKTVEQSEKQTPVKNVTIKRFIKYDDNFYRGSKPSESQYKELADLGIKTVIDLRLNSKKKNEEIESLLNKYNIKFVSIPLHPSIPPTKKQTETFFSIINNPKMAPVYVHCTHGQDRTGIMSALYRVEKCNWNYDQAYKEMVDVGYHPNLYKKQKIFLKQYTEEKKSKNTSKE